MSQAALADFYLRRPSLTGSVVPEYKEGIEEPLHAKEEMYAAYGGFS